ncbi:hypothetical protein D7S89_04775 [Trinickia fusca]|uniref:Lipoprotein n=1 Tax=Trinickia fusca TaxID=2419777 RepID=A0A494XSX6_9BURK|nr:hypothetical protein D7S89_04775 [Trinickia fusca]
MPRGSGAQALLGVLAAGVLLSGCVVAPSGQVLSRLAPEQPGAAAPAHPLTETEKKRYDEIDQQVIKEQNEAMAADEWARYWAPNYYPAYPAYYPAPVMFGGYYGGWNGGVGYYSPGWWW